MYCKSIDEVISFYGIFSEDPAQMKRIRLALEFYGLVKQSEVEAAWMRNRTEMLDSIDRLSVQLKEYEQKENPRRQA